ncbi:MAG: PepSY domain-containing protein [Mogibacterium sp.]|nr:PepSY domain-containing protein [Mogibacterium sp.]
MTDKRIKESLVNAIENSTPDILDSLMSELNITSEPKALVRDVLAVESGLDKNWTRKKNVIGGRWIKTAMSCAAALVFVIVGISLYNNNKEVFALVSLDVNPGIEISIDDKERVMSANPVNDEAEKILADMDLKGSDINVACNAIVGSMLTQGYLTELSNSILVSVSAQDEAAGTEIERKLSENLNSYLENSEIAAAILGQYVNDDEELRAFAQANDISIGKAWLMKSLLASGSTKMTEEDLLKLSTQELILLGQKRGVTSNTSYGDAESGKYIGSDKAISIALERAGIDISQTTNLRYEFDCEHGVLIYEVTFRAGDYEYDYDINAIDGSVVAHEKEYEGPPPAAVDNSGGSSGNASSSGGGTGKVNSGGNTKKNKKKSNNSNNQKVYYDDDDDDDDDWDDRDDDRDDRDDGDDDD